MITDLIVWASVALATAFVCAWAWSPALRAWIEEPKHRFLESSRRYDATTLQVRVTGRGHEGRSRPTEPHTP